MTITCRNCGYLIDTHTRIAGHDANPKDGDISVCLKCGYLGEFRKGGIVALSHAKYMALDAGTKAHLLKIEKVRKRIMETHGVAM